jgi:ORF6N domain
MLDFDIAELYEVETKVLNQAVKRNAGKFPEDFMFKLTVNEWQFIRLQFVTGSEKKNRSQTATSSQKHRSTPPYAFTKHGVTMLASV